MTGVVISKMGTGGITINIPLQFDSLDHLTRVITDGFTTSDIAGSLQLPDSLKDLACVAGAGFSALPAVVSPETMLMMNMAQMAISGPIGLNQQVSAASEQLNQTIEGSMRSLAEIAAAGTFEEAQEAMAQFAPDADGSGGGFGSLMMGGVMPAMTEMQKFLSMSKSMQSEGPLGMAIDQMNSIAENAGMISAMGNLASAVASGCRMAQPTSAVDDAFDLLTDGVANTQTQILAQSMKAIQNVIEIPPASGRMDDLNDVVWQNTPQMGVAAAGTYAGKQVMQIHLEQAAMNGLIPTDGEPGIVNIPGWLNPNSGLMEYIPAVKLSESLGGAESSLLSKASSIKAAIDSALAPLEALASSVGLAAVSSNLPPALDLAIDAGMKALMSSASKDIMSSAAGEIPSSGQADGRPIEEGGSGPNL